MKRALFLIAIIGLLFVSCQVSSKISTSGIRAGMTKEEVINKLGKPYKSSFNRSDDNVLLETIYYKELIIQMSGQSSLISALKFKNNVLVSLNQDREHPLDNGHDNYYPQDDANE